MYYPQHGYTSRSAHNTGRRPGTSHYGYPPQSATTTWTAMPQSPNTHHKRYPAGYSTHQNPPRSAYYPVGYSTNTARASPAASHFSGYNPAQYNQSNMGYMTDQRSQFGGVDKWKSSFVAPKQRPTHAPIPHQRQQVPVPVPSVPQFKQQRSLRNRAAEEQEQTFTWTTSDDEEEPTTDAVNGITEDTKKMEITPVNGIGTNQSQTFVDVHHPDVPDTPLVDQPPPLPARDEVPPIPDELRNGGSPPPKVESIHPKNDDDTVPDQNNNNDDVFAEPAPGPSSDPDPQPAEDGKEVVATQANLNESETQAIQSMDNVIDTLADNPAAPAQPASPGPPLPPAHPNTPLPPMPLAGPVQPMPQTFGQPPQGPTFQFKLPNQTMVFVYSADITRLRVDVIVNAANEKLKHSGGVAKAIARAAGKDLQRESSQYVEMYGKLQVGQVARTEGWNLPCRCVLHAVGPQWKGPKKKEDTQKKLSQTIYTVFHKANVELNMTTLAIPPISAGIYGVPIQVVAEAMADALITYDINCRPTSNQIDPKQIHIVDINPANVAVIVGHFQQRFKTVDGPDTTKSQKHRRKSSDEKYAVVSKARARKRSQSRDRSRYSSVNGHPDDDNDSPDGDVPNGLDSSSPNLPQRNYNADNYTGFQPGMPGGPPPNGMPGGSPNGMPGGPPNGMPGGPPPNGMPGIPPPNGMPPNPNIPHHQSMPQMGNFPPGALPPGYGGAPMYPYNMNTQASSKKKKRSRSKSKDRSKRDAQSERSFRPDGPRMDTASQHSAPFPYGQPGNSGMNGMSYRMPQGGPMYQPGSVGTGMNEYRYYNGQQNGTGNQDKNCVIQ